MLRRQSKFSLQAYKKFASEIGSNCTAVTGRRPPGVKFDTAIFCRVKRLDIVCYFNKRLYVNI